MAKVTVGSYIEHYQILEELGKGGMGVVYKALNVNLDKFVAIKTISLGLASEEIITNRFRTEARALAKLQNPNIVSIFDLRVDDNQWFIVMEYVDGTTLAQKIREQEAVPWQECLKIFKQILSAIGHAHRAGIIHRDIKPNNIMLGRDGMVKITDFGLAKDQRNLSHTQTSSTGGTLYYMSPEQVKGLQFTDNRSDIYSLGLTLYEMLAGKIPFRKDDNDYTIREAIIKRQFPPPTHFNPAIPVGLNTIVMRAIEKRPEDRFQNVDEMLVNLEQFEQNADISLTEPLKHISEHEFSNIHPADFEISYLSDPIVTEKPGPEEPNSPKKSVRLRYAIGGIAAGVLAMLVYFLIGWLAPAPMAELMVVSNPRSADLMVNGEQAGQTPVHNFQVRSGPVDIRLEKDTFLPLDTIVHIESDTLNYFSYDLVPAGMIKFSTSPPDARIWINGRILAANRQTELLLAQGTYDIRVEREGYRINRDKIEILHGDHISRTYNLQIVEPQLNSTTRLVTESPEKVHNFSKSQPQFDTEIFKTGAMAVRSEPVGAEIWLDGYRIPSLSSPCVVTSIAPGLHQIELQKEGYTHFSTAVMIAPEETTSVQADMIRLMGDIRILVKPWGTIFIDDQLVRENTNTIYIGSYGTGSHDLRVIHPTFGVWEQTVQIVQDRSAEIQIDFNKFVYIPVTAFDVEGKPVWADIIVDNQETGEVTPKEVAFRIGIRTVAAKKDGYVLVNGEKEFLVTENHSEPLKFILRKVVSSQAYRP